MDKQQLKDCHQRIKPFIHDTPVLTSRLIDKMGNANFYFKCENFQRMGAFKMRGAANAILQLTPDQKKNGVVTHSSGNFAQALSLAAQSLGVKAYIVMPSSAPEVKKEAVRGYSGILSECEPTLTAREQATQEIINKQGATFIHPSNNEQVILGQGTACMELLKLYPDLDYVFTPVGGGGLLAGTALAVHYFGKNCKTIGGEPFEVDDAFRSLKSGKIETNTTTNTIADGLKTQLGERNFPIIQEYVEEIVRVKEQEIVHAMRLIWERLKIVCEPSSAVALAACFKKKELLTHKKVGIIISGGNVDLSKLPFRPA
ncbi:pyridoxal-phosphate dependent enzyme [Muricauda ruestringensis]|uniref:pyridoxal-phosphate dependent enzyme n=1 Tax=Flagellimonas ruestringensis TaxID=111501 RepID=UPI001CD40696|nr:pyridoxal-phosphate dependent enzyme [Allomuricauda ruestringensis]MCA0958248.1 pyridoxal-phosphate dependent enzyme [Allomuricauda ruestringensis]